MAELSHESTGPLPAPRPDTPFGLLVGLYGATILGLAAAAAVSAAGIGTAYPVGLGVGFLAVVLGTAGATRVPGLAVRLGATRLRWGLVAAPALFVPAAFALNLSVRWTVFAFAAAVGGTVWGAFLAVASHTRYTRAVVDEATVDGEWRARQGPTQRRNALLAAAGLTIAGMVAFLAGLFTENWAVQSVGQVLIPAGAGFVGYARSSRYRASSAGLERRFPVARNLLPWADCTGYAVTDEAILIHRRRPWWPAVTIDREDVDTESVVAALDRYLDGR
ncbi:hypothetical protein GJ629_10320 [Halapricum sp. CBA1109]|uniref:hypothetical protein n=1 Tax=Halapricum sp. CBA1109 TaxID=2668068 RepID=UPI0012FC412D|nr:hypothetical protein [Halapricum sp. CBA1109]MUV90235.1 hypothetical protein [Halapricum sp. CBA1109]